MNKTLVFLIGLVVVGTAITVFFFQNSRQDLLVGRELPPITEKELEGIYSLVAQESEGVIKRFGSSFLTEGALINIVHVVKDGSSYGISCKLGPAYDTAKLDRFLSGEMISLGQIKECSIETAQKIDQTITSKEKQCLVPLSSDMSNFIANDYYLVALVLEEREITQELIDAYDENRLCARSFNGLLGEMSPTVLVVIVDLNVNHIYY